MPRRELEPFVERAEQRLRGAADVRHLLPVQALRSVPEGRRWAVTAGRDRDRRNPAADERRLLVEAEREAQIGQLSERARPARGRPALLGDPRGRALDQDGRRRARLVGCHLEARLSLAADRVEVDHREDPVPVRVVLREAGGAEPPEGTPVGGEEDQPVLGADGLGRGAGRGRVPARQLDQGGRARRVVVRARTQARVVAMGHDHDRVGVLRACGEEDVAEEHATAARDRRVESVHLRLEPVEPHLVDQPASRPERPGGSRCAVGIEARELPGERHRSAAVEGRRQVRRRERGRSLDAEGDDQQR